MRCVECQREVEGYFDGELDEQRNRLVEQHLSACASCASLYRKLEGEQELYLHYKCEAEPAPAFWDNVMARAAQDNTAPRARSFSLLRDWLGRALGNFNARRFSPALMTLLVLVAIGVTVGVMRFINSREAQIAHTGFSQNKSAPAQAEPARPEMLPREGDGKGSELVAGTQPPLPLKNRATKKSRSALTASNETYVRGGLNRNAESPNPTPIDLVREAEQKYVAAIAMLSRDVNRRRSRLDPETIARFERSLAAIDRTIADTRQVARKHPGDPVAAQYMLTAYAKKVDVLREMVGY